MRVPVAFFLGVPPYCPMLYFAYGSNMSPAQMAARCPGAQPVGAACLKDWRFLITSRGSANIAPCRHGSEVYGVVWNCRPHHVATLDAFEGVSWRNYLHRWVRLECMEGGPISALAYTSLRRRPGRANANYLLTAVLPGAYAFDLPAHYLDELRDWLPARVICDRRRTYVGRR